MTLDVVVLAAGQGTRMRSALPKVLHTLAGKPMVQHVLDTAKAVGSTQLHLVVGHGAEKVQEAIREEANWVLQAQQLGTGHAVQQVLPHLPREGKVLILYGDVPLTAADTLRQLVQLVDEKRLALLTTFLDDPTGYGRIVRDATQRVTSIVEHKDASEEQRGIREINTGILCVPAAALHRWLPALKNDNAQGEYYLTDIIGMAVAEGCEVATVHPLRAEEVAGVNNRVQLAELERWYQREQANRLMTEGATVIDPARVEVRGELIIGKDVYIDINAVFEGRVVLGDNVSIGPNCVIIDSEIGEGTQIKAFSHLEGAKIARQGDVGPYARLRPGTELADKAKIGNFVETKKSRIGVGSKVNHLTYIGDAEIGEGANVGAGTITCNYDGVNKFKTTIGDGAFIGSNSSLVAPVNIGAMATVGAGSTITGDVPADSLAVARGKQRNIEGWKRPTKQDKK